MKESNSGLESSEKTDFLVKRHSFSRMNILIHLNSALDYVTFMSSSLKQQQKDIERDMQNKIKEADSIQNLGSDDMSDQLDYLTEEFSERIYEMKEVFPQIQWRTQFIFAMSLFEEAMNNICQHSEIHSNLAVTYKDFQGMGTGRCKVYLSKIHGLESAFSEAEWSDIQKYKVVRNILVHANGNLSEQSKKNLKTIKHLCNTVESFKVKRFGREISVIDEKFEDGSVFIDEYFVTEAIKKLKFFLAELCDQKVNSVRE